MTVSGNHDLKDNHDETSGKSTFFSALDTVSDCRFEHVYRSCALFGFHGWRRHGGGVVFYVDETGQHGLIAAKSDIPGHSTGLAEGHYTWADAKTACDNL